MMEDLGQDRLVIRKEDLPPGDGIDENGPKRRADTLAIVALILGIASVLFAGVAIGPIAMICGVVALLRGRSSEDRGRLYAILGVLTGTAGLLLWLGLLWWFLVGGQPPVVPTHDAPSPRPSTITLDRDAIDRAPAPLRRALLASVSLLIEGRHASSWSVASSGSGAVIAAAGDRFYILTCRHVVDGLDTKPGDLRLRVLWVSGEGRSANVEWKSPVSLDLAVVSTQVPPGTVPPMVVPIGHPRNRRVGDHVFAVGDPLDYRTSFVTGVLSAVRTVGEGAAATQVFQSQIPLNPGNSGGGLYDEAGELVGVNSWTLPKSIVEGMGFSISVENLWNAIEGAPEHVAEVLRSVKPRLQNSAMPGATSEPAREN